VVSRDESLLFQQYRHRSDISTTLLPAVDSKFLGNSIALQGMQFIIL